MVVAFLVVFVVQQSSCRLFLGCLSRFLVSLRVKVLQELFEAQGALLLKSLDFGQNAVNSCVESFDVVAHFGLAHTGLLVKIFFRLTINCSASTRVSGTLIIERRPCRHSHTPSSYWSALTRISASVLIDVSISFVMIILSSKPPRGRDFRRRRA